DWTRTDDQGHVLGRGHFDHGAATWTSFYADGKKLAEGAFANSQPSGTWKLYHPSGNLAATGRLKRGARDGNWRFYYDTPDKTRIAEGAFAGADLTGT